MRAAGDTKYQIQHFSSADRMARHLNLLGASIMSLYAGKKEPQNCQLHSLLKQLNIHALFFYWKLLLLFTFVLLVP